MAEIILKRRSGQIQLPDDFYMSISLTRITRPKFHVLYQRDCILYTDNECFHITRDSILFYYGPFRKNWFIKQLQKLHELLFPVKYKLEYMSISEINKIIRLEGSEMDCTPEDIARLYNAFQQVEIGKMTEAGYLQFRDSIPGTTKRESQ